MDYKMNKGGYETSCNSPKSYKVVHVHPTLRCNLFCQHCYSSSAPSLKDGLQVDSLKPFLTYAYEKGFNVLSISGGEPFLYEHLKELLLFAKEIGYQTQIASNGMLLKGAKAQECLDLIDVIAISIDGPQIQHDQIRGLDGAFNKTLEGIKILKKQKRAFGIIHTITNETWKNLIWLVEIAREYDAKLLQLHPLELYGRAKDYFCKDFLTQESLHKTYLLGKYLQSKYIEEIYIQMDFLHRDYIINNPRVVNYRGETFKLTQQNFTEQINTIIIDEGGVVYPISYGFSNQFEICKLSNFIEGQDVFSNFIEKKGKGLYSIISDCYHEIIKNKNDDLVAWTEYIVKKSNNYYCVLEGE